LDHVFSSLSWPSSSPFRIEDSINKNNYQYIKGSRPKIIKLLYILSIVGAAIASLFLITLGFTVSTVIGVLMLLIGAPLVFLLSVIYARVLLEIMIVIFRISEHTAQIVEKLGKISLQPSAG